MANDFYEIYRANNMRLAKTMVIKFEVSALATNRYLVQINEPVSSDKRTWRYYMNIAGLYHSTNEAMQVVSLDTGETIDFTTDNLRIHRSTARAYAYGSSYYDALVTRYRDNESLILGILNPVDIDTAIAAKEGEILWMDAGLIDPNEDNLKELIQKQIDAFLERWHVEMYSQTEELYDGIRLAILFANLCGFIEVARMKNSRTHRSHSFHIRQFLASNGRLDKYMDYMTLQQRLFFYRNLRYLHRHPGWQDSFNWLVENVMEARGLPLADYTLSQNISSMPEAVTPNIELVRREITKAYRDTPETTATVLEVLEKQATIARGNADILNYAQDEVIMLMESSKVGQLQTKVLESSILDLTDSDIFNLEDFLINHWMYLASEERYRAIVAVDNPKTGDVIQLSALDAFILFIFAYNLAIDYRFEQVPVMVANHVLKAPTPTASQMLAIADPKYASQTMATALWDLVPKLDYYVATETFYTAVAAVHRGAIDQYNLAAYNGNYNIRLNAEIMAEYMFMDRSVRLSGSATMAYDDWLQVRGLEAVSTFTRTELDQLWKALLSTATGINLNASLKLADVHKAMVGIMERMSSYSVHYLREVNESPFKPLANRFIRSGDSLVEETGVNAGDIIGELNIKSNGTHHAIKVMDDDLGLDIVDKSVTVEGSAFFEFGIAFEEQTTRVNRPEAEFTVIKFIEPVLRPPVDLSAYGAVSDIVVGPVGLIEIPLNSVIVVNVLDGLHYPASE